ncbi:MAG: hypothetical protein KAJ01_00795, partial [Candidatus Hydrogenedentes bacterium]|nr:hypothetical protein [Candidatus Hydrogenedentota bacterium]
PEPQEAELAEEVEQLEEQEAEVVAQLAQKIEPELPAEQREAIEKERAEQEELQDKLERTVTELEEQKVAAAKLVELNAEKSNALADAESELEQLEQALAKAAEEGRSTEEEAESADLREQLSLQKEAYAKLQTGVDDEIEKRAAELERRVKTELEKSEQETRDALEAQKNALAELQDMLVAEAAEKAELAKQLAETSWSPGMGPERGRRQVAGPPASDSTEQKVTLNFRDADLGAVLDILSRKADINLLAGGDVTGTVTARLVDVPLMKAMELVLRENGYGIVHEDGIYRVVSLKLAEEMGLATTTDVFRLEYATASAMVMALKDMVTAKGKLVADDNANVVIVTDDPGNMSRIAEIIREIDVPQTIVDTVTGTFRLSYLDAVPSAQMLEKMVTEHGSVLADVMTNSLILTDVPANFQVISDLIAELDQRPDQVFIEVLMFDAIL